MALPEDDLRNRAAQIAKETGMDELEAFEMLAIATGLSSGCTVLLDEDGRPLPTPETTVFDRRADTE